MAGRWLDPIYQDAKYAARTLAKNPGFTAVAALSLGLGIGANTAIFTLVDNILLKALPVRNPGELAVLARNPSRPSASFNYPDYEYLRDHSASYTSVAATSGGGMPVGMTLPNEGQGAAPQLVQPAMVSGNYFQTLGVQPVVGRVLNPEDNRKPGAAPYAVLSYNFWQSRFGGDPRVIGRTVRLNAAMFTVVGVSAAGFNGTSVGQAPDVYLPIMMAEQVNAAFRGWNTRHWWWLTVLGRRKPGVSFDQARAELDVLFKQIEAADPESRPAPTYDKDREIRRKAVVLPGTQGYSYLRNQAEKPLTILMIVVGVVLLIACANVANLLLARAAGRRKEIAIRLAVGAGRRRLIGQLILEGIILSVIGGAVGLLFAIWGARLLVTLIPQGFTPSRFDLSPDWRLLAFTFGISVVTGLFCGLAPGLQATRPDLASALKSETGGSGAGPRLGRFDLRRGLVVFQVALALLLVIGAGLFLRTLQNLRNIKTGFSRERVLVVRIDPTQSGYKAQRTRQFYDRLVEGVASERGVRSVSTAQIIPLGGMRWNSDVAVEGYTWKPTERPYLDLNAVGPRFFETFGIPLLLGRDFRAEDNPAVATEMPEGPPKEDEHLPPPAPVAIVNEAFAKKFWPNESAVGKRFTMGERFRMDNSFEIVGVAGDARYFELKEPVEPMIYVPAWRLPARSAMLVVRTTGDPQELAGAVVRQARQIDPAVPVIRSQTMEEQATGQMAAERIIAVLCGFFGVLAVGLAAVGLYGVMAQMVARRYREIGIRVALGAARRDVIGLVMRETAVLVGLGALVGLPAGLGLTRLVSSFLYGLKPQDPATMAIALAVLCGVTMLAAWIPARRAARVDPMAALRWE